MFLQIGYPKLISLKKYKDIVIKVIELNPESSKPTLEFHVKNNDVADVEFTFSFEVAKAVSTVILSTFIFLHNATIVPFLFNHLLKTQASINLMIQAWLPNFEVPKPTITREIHKNSSVRLYSFKKINSLKDWVK